MLGTMLISIMAASRKGEGMRIVRSERVQRSCETRTSAMPDRSFSRMSILHSLRLAVDPAYASSGNPEPQGGARFAISKGRASAHCTRT